MLRKKNSSEYTEKGKRSEPKYFWNILATSDFFSFFFTVYAVTIFIIMYGFKIRLR